MSFLCCGVKYSKFAPETYWCIDTYLINKRTGKEIVDVLTCKKNGCLKIQISKYDKNKKLIERKELKGKTAIQYLADTKNTRVKQPLICPIQNLPTKTKNDFRYGKVIDSTTQRVRFLNEQGRAENKKIKSECKIYNGAGLG